jgi:redox-sensitive bicupin YhaK (pirin superfamily)
MDGLSHMRILKCVWDPWQFREHSPSSRDASGRLNGVQLWVALRDSHRHMPASFAHVAQVPAIESRGGRVQVFAGTLQGETSPATHFSEIVGADVQVHRHHTLTLPLEPAFEHALLLLSGDATLDDQPLEERVLYYVGRTRSEARVSSRSGSRVLLIGGPPFPEKILMWWNFVARTEQEIAHARADWEAGQRFGAVQRFAVERSEPGSLRSS